MPWRAQLTLVVIMVLTLGAGVGGRNAIAQGGVATPTGEEMTPTDVVAQVAPAVVTVLNLQVGEGAPAGQSTTRGSGTGFIIDDEGHIVTNWHVVTGGEEFAVMLYDGTSLEADLIGSDPRDDLAVVKIDPGSVPRTVSFGDSDALLPGQSVLAIGSPLGAFTNTVTLGIVSALGRNEFASGSICQNYSNLIQHDAAINPGNSGGPLFNLQGEVVGVNTLGLPQDQGGTPIQGLFFAVPSSTVTEVAQQLIATGTIEHPYLGINMVPIDPALANQNQLPVDAGMYVTAVTAESPAAAAGIQEGDIIRAIEGQELTATFSLADGLFEHAPGETVSLTVLRNGEEQDVSITLGQAPAELFAQCTLQEQS
jgi:2-alkenal reductase